MIPKSELEPDCKRCRALCCVAPYFDRSDTFAYTKYAGAPCRHLNDDYRCTIHDDLARYGFGGCESYQCFGAGQKVVEQHFPDQSWRSDPALARRMFDTYFAIKALHELMACLTEARGHCRDATTGARLDALCVEINARTLPGAVLPTEEETESYRQEVSGLLSGIGTGRRRRYLNPILIFTLLDIFPPDVLDLVLT